MVEEAITTHVHTRSAGCEKGEGGAERGGIVDRVPAAIDQVGCRRPGWSDKMSMARTRMGVRMKTNMSNVDPSRRWMDAKADARGKARGSEPVRQNLRNILLGRAGLAEQGRRDGRNWSSTEEAATSSRAAIISAIPPTRQATPHPLDLPNTTALALAH